MMNERKQALYCRPDLAENQHVSSFENSYPVIDRLQRLDDPWWSLGMEYEPSKFVK
ncbi:hypothetical protein VCHA47P369_100030 [Vibrio chagasii]|nr:hypothetical protein VCHA27O13_230029 [Vibrio chagasii]CAH6815371.1 hypothetical protein VCHA29O37_130117 [Vibrio chagasii]CAH6828882.1 hypothetical protein VCHA31O71_190027 [Vibrio chagasii]CAH6836901.1 hypothetical protein VCHA37O173_190031 [Vibrio chagasii]CAH6864272.1 hypothetical protein VCHA35O135_210029 [Vibrio chagasii]